jgi:hypothetical protein
MSNQGWEEVIAVAQVDGSALSNSTSATSLLPGAAKRQLPANVFQIGSVLRVRAYGRVSNIVTTPGTLTLDLRLGSVIVFNGGAVSLNTTAKTNVSWVFDALLTCRAIGATTTANFMGQGTLTSESVVGAAANTTLTASLPASAPAVGTGFDSTAAQILDFFGTFSIANSGNAITLHQFVAELCN